MKKQAKHKSKKRKRNQRIIEYGLLALFIGLLFTTDLKAEVFGFIQRGFLQIGLFSPRVDQSPATDDDTASFTTSYKAHHLLLKDQNGKTRNLANLRGKVVFINFWATWCPPCVAEMPNINKLYKTFADNDQVVFLMISMDRNFEKAKRFLDRKGYAFNIYKPVTAIPNEFRSRGIPNTFVLGKDGKIEMHHLGMGQYNTTKFKTFLNHLAAQ